MSDESDEIVEGDFVCFDTEDNSPLLLKAGLSGADKVCTQIAALGRRCQEYHSAGDVPGFLHWLQSQGENCVAYAHNLQYDLGNLFRDNLDELDVRMVGGRLISARWRNIKFLDSFNIWPMSLKKVGSAVGLEKGVLDIHSRDYVMRDVQIVRKAMIEAQRFAALHGVAGLPSTLGGLCVKLWSAMGGKNFRCTDRFARAAYYGGRVELFHVGGRGRIGYTDINSLYPWCMTQTFPEDWCELDSLDGWGAADVTLQIPKDFVAPLPVRREDGSVYYPHGLIRPTPPPGEKEGAWTLHEIRDALAHGAKLKAIHRVMGSEAGGYPYRDFVNKFYELRRTETNGARNLMLKLCLNNLYGRLGNSGMVTRSFNLKAEDFTEEGTYVADGTPFGTKRLANVQMPLDSTTNYIHAAYVTAYGRLELMRYLRQIGAGRLIYCDTDSVMFFMQRREIPFPISDALGAMKLEGYGWKCLTFAPKVYQFGTDFKAKGIRRDMAKQFVQAGSVAIEQPYKFREAATFFDAKLDAEGRVLRGKNTKPLSVWRVVVKRRISKYDRKTQDASGVYWPKKHSAK